MSAASKKGGQRLWALFTSTPRLSGCEQREAKADARQWTQPKQEKLWDVDRPSPRHCAFAQRSQDHLSVYFIFSFCTAAQAARLRKAMEEGADTSDWEWPLTHAPKIIQRLSWNDRQEAWRLLGEGGEP
jgi:hypothetical protein